MSFGDDEQVTPAPPALPPPPPTAPQFATGLGKAFPRGKPFGGTLITNPAAPAPSAQTTNKSLVTL